MEYETKDEELIRRYLVGELTEGEMQTVEERIMTDKEFSGLALFVEDKMVEDYIEGRLSVKDRENFEKLFLATRQGAEQVSFTHALKEYASKDSASEKVVEFSQRSRPSTFGRSRWALAAAAIILIAAGAGILRVFFPQPEIEGGIIAFNKAYEKQRPLEARLTGLPHAPTVNTRGDDEGKVDSSNLRRAELIFKGEAGKKPGSESFHLLGLYYLAQQDFDQAIDQLQKALGFAPNDARIYSDFGAAYLEKGKAAKQTQSDGGVQYFSQSLEYLNKAIDLDQNLLEARFNRALLYQQNSPAEQTVNEWKEYLKRDSTSPWAVEAQRNIDEVEKQNR